MILAVVFPFSHAGNTAAIAPSTLLQFNPPLYSDCLASYLLTVLRLRFYATKKEKELEKNHLLLLKGPNPSSFLFIFVLFKMQRCEYVTINDKSVDGVLGIRTQGGRMEDADKSSEL